MDIIQMLCLAEMEQNNFVGMQRIPTSLARPAKPVEEEEGGDEDPSWLEERESRFWPE